MRLLIWLSFGLSNYIFSQAAAAQMQNDFEHRKNSSGSQLLMDPTAEQSGHDFQFGVQYSRPTLTLEIAGSRNLAKSPDLDAYEDQQPITGTYKGGSALSIKTVASVFLGKGPTHYSLGAGLENLELGLQQWMSKSGPSEARFQMNSIVLELGIQRELNEWVETLLNIYLTQSLDGKLQSRYLSYSSLADTLATKVLVDDALTSGTRLGFNGQYLFNIVPSLAFGVGLSAEYGVLKFSTRESASNIFGYSWAFLILMKI